MAISNPTTVGRIGLGVLGVMLTLSAGCVSKWPFLKREVPTPHQVVVQWHNEIGFAPDVHKQGDPTAGFAGRMYLFTSGTPRPIPADGTLTITLYDPNTMTADGKPLAVQNWILPPEMLAKMRKRDYMGDGYTLFLPWASYHPSVKEVLLRTKYEPKNGVPLFFDGGVLKIGAMKVVKPPTIKKGRRIGPPKEVLPQPKVVPQGPVLPQPTKVTRSRVPIYPQR